MLKRAQNWLATRQNDPVPTALTASGVVISIAALGFGWGWWTKPWDSTGFSVNLLADLALIGPALLLSNVIVVRIRAARARARIEPLLRVTIGLLLFVVKTTQQACDLLGVEASLDMPPDSTSDVTAMTFPRLVNTLRGAHAALQLAHQLTDLSKRLEIKEPFQFPKFGLILRIIRQMNEEHPMPWTINAANAAEDWSDRCGVDFFYYGMGPKDPKFSTRDRKVGLTQIREDSVGVLQGTDIGTAGYLHIVDACLRHAEAIATTLARDLPKSLRQ